MAAFYQYRYQNTTSNMLDNLGNTQRIEKKWYLLGLLGPALVHLSNLHKNFYTETNRPDFIWSKCSGQR